MATSLKNGRGRIRCYADHCRNWATVWRYLYYDAESERRYLPVCPIDDPQAEAVVTEHQPEAAV